MARKVVDYVNTTAEEHRAALLFANTLFDWSVNAQQKEPDALADFSHRLHTDEATLIRNLHSLIVICENA